MPAQAEIRSLKQAPKAKRKDATPQADLFGS
jgi:hypothetical protein